MGKTFSTGLLTNGIWQDASNNIGIGGSPSGSYKFEVTGTGRFTGALNATTTFTLDGTKRVFLRSNQAAASGLLSGSALAAEGNFSIYSDSGVAAEVLGMYYWNGSTYRSALQFANVSSGNSNLILMKDGGNVGIGTSSPTYKLDITATGYGIQHYADASNYLRTYCGSTYQIIESNGTNQFGYVGGNFFIQTSGTERMRITSGGKVYMNTTTDLPYDSATLAVKENGGIAAGFKGGTGVWAIKVGTVDTGATRYMIGFCNDSAVTIGGITTNGSNTSYNTSSDKRLKENIKPIENALYKVLKLKPVTFDWVNTGISDDGFIAQDLLELDEFKNRVNGIGKGEDETEYYGVDYMRFVSILTAAIQEQQALIQELSAKVSALENKS